MKEKIEAAIFLLLVLLSVDSGREAFSNELDLYREANRALGSQEKIFLASERSRLVVWRARAASGEIGIIVLTDLRKYPEEVFLTLPGYTVSSKGISARPHQCSWWRAVSKRSIIYACGIAMRPSSQRELVTRDMISDLASQIKGVKPLRGSWGRDTIEMVFLK